jgi:hypothetical protein
LRTRRVPLGVGIFRLPTPVKIRDELRDASKTGIGLISLRSSVKKGESPLTQAEAPESTRTTSLAFSLASMAQMRTLLGLLFPDVEGR